MHIERLVGLRGILQWVSPGYVNAQVAAEHSIKDGLRAVAQLLRCGQIIAR